MGADPDRQSGSGLRARLGWFVLLYCGSALAFAAMVYAIRALIPH
jgi:hypothetical protein